MRSLLQFMSDIMRIALWIIGFLMVVIGARRW